MFTPLQLAVGHASNGDYSDLCFALSGQIFCAAGAGFSPR
jgi:hypothetical protein